MNVLDSILPWRSGNADEPTDPEKIYEERVQERCDHDEWDDSVVQGGIVDMDHAHVKDGFLVVPTYEKAERYCQNCGLAYHHTHNIPGINGPEVVLESGRVAVPVAFTLDDGVSIAEALYEPVREQADYEVNPEGQVTPIEGDDEGRVLVNKSEQERDEQADDLPVAAGGATD